MDWLPLSKFHTTPDKADRRRSYSTVRCVETAPPSQSPTSAVETWTGATSIDRTELRELVRIESPAIGSREAVHEVRGIIHVLEPSRVSEFMRNRTGASQDREPDDHAVMPLLRATDSRLVGA